MYHKRSLLFILFIFLGLNASSAVFVVTNKADSGPGTLREALTKAAANGNTERDYINFNLPGTSEAEKTITILTNLPAITSDIVIDGSTQPGNEFSINGAKVVITSNGHSINEVNIRSVFLVKGVNYFEMDGLIIKNLFYDPSQYRPYGGTAVFVAETNKQIVIGKPGKGNVMYNLGVAIETALGKDYEFANPSFTDKMELKNNFIGVAEDGIKIGTYLQSTLLLYYVYNLLMGGDSKSEGNVVFGVAAISPGRQDDQLKENVNFKIKNNIFSANAFQQRTTDPNIVTDRNNVYLTFNVDVNLNYNFDTKIEVSDNVFGYALLMQGFKRADVVIQGNSFGTSSDKRTILPLEGGGIFLRYLKGTTLIGGDNLSKGNTFTHCSEDSQAVFYGEAAINVVDFDGELSQGNNVELSHNSIYCNNYRAFEYHFGPDKKPLSVTIDNLTPTSVSGTTKPNARVELFYTDKECTQCQPETYIASVNAGQNGKWTYNGNLLPGYGVMAGATLNHISSEFTDTRIYAVAPYNQVTYSECEKGGNIQGTIVVNAKKIAWLDNDGKVVGTNVDLINVPPGKYRLRAEQFGCVQYSQVIEIFDNTPVILTDNLKITFPSCNLLGSITGIDTRSADKTEWLDKNGRVISNAYNVDNLPEGSYTFRITGQRGCVKTYGPIVLKMVSGPVINQTSLKIQSTPCGQSSGSITNISISGSGTLKYSWTNNLQQVVGTAKDLVNQPAGTYILKVTDDTQCGPVYTGDIIIPETNGITLDESNVQTAIAICGKNNGSVTGVKVTGATQYRWTDANNKTVGTTAALENVSSGDYMFIASNNFGCVKSSKVYHVALQATTQFPSYNADVVPSCFGDKNGSVSITTDALVKSLRWVNSQGATAGNQSLLAPVAAGKYQLYLTDQNGCESYYNTYTVDEIPEFTVANPGVRMNDHCGLKIGSINNVTITGGVPPYTYNWLNADMQVLGTTNSINCLFAGKYVLHVVDTRCGNLDIAYVIADESEIVAAPATSVIQLCSSGNALLTVKNASSAVTYRLYDSQSSVLPLDEEKGGRFNISVSGNRDFFVSQLNGTCESPRAQIKVIVGLSVVNIANTFTPNGDGINDYWKISQIENYPAATVQVFTRYGQEVFESKGYSSPFNGTMNGKALPAGVYYYIINLKTDCNILSGSLTLIR